jgi:hypothetical protein
VKRILSTGLRGNQIVRLIPETDDDLAELRKLDEQGELDVSDSFGDDPAAWAPSADAETPGPPRRRPRRSA